MMFVETRGITENWIVFELELLLPFTTTDQKYLNTTRYDKMCRKNSAFSVKKAVKSQRIISVLKRSISDIQMHLFQIFKRIYFAANA